jgi:hypothetical protein
VNIAVEPTVFFAAVNECVFAGLRPHPVQGRNAGIVSGCRRWLETIPGGEHVLAGLDDPNRRFMGNVELLTAAIEADPAIREGHLAEDIVHEHCRQRALFAVPPLMFWTRPHALIETTDALARMLVASDLGDDLPTTLLRPPFPACYLSFGREFQQVLSPDDNWPEIGYSRPRGVYIFEATRDSTRALAFVTIHDLPGEPLFGIAHLDFVVTDEAQPLNDKIRSIAKLEGAEHKQAYLSLTQIVAKVFLYMASPQAVLVEERRSSDALDKLGRLGPKKASRVQRQLPDLWDRIVLGPTEIPGHGHGEVSPHLRRGHFRMQPHGPQMSLRKLMFISPTWVRADRLQAGD